MLLALASATCSSAVSPPTTNASQVVVPHGKPIQVVLENDAGGYVDAQSLANAVDMAVASHAGVHGFRIQVTMLDVRTCGNPDNAASVAVNAANAVVADLQNVAVIGQVCSFGFARALPVFESAHVVALSGSATDDALPAAGPTVFDRTAVDNNDGFDAWYATVSTLPSDLAWQQAYATEFGAPPGLYADLYYDAARLLIHDLRVASHLDHRSLVIDRTALGQTVRQTTGYRGVTCTITIDPATGNRVDDTRSLAKCLG
jgi:ABC-type branched-subunit amino acid transport system substrate-binding protein